MLHDDPLAPDGPRRPPSRHEIGQPLDALSINELGERIEQLRTEIQRLEQARDGKEASKRAADVFFKS